GFVSMAWHLDVSSANNWGATTATLPNYATKLYGLDALQPGDMIDLTTTHVVLFIRWTDSSHSTAVVQQENQTGTPANQATYSRSYLTQNNYQPYRYNNVVESPTPVNSAATYPTQNNISVGAN